MLNHTLQRNASSSTSAEGSVGNAGSGNSGSGNSAGMVGNNGIVQGDTGEGFEFTKRKKWPQLLLTELIGSAVFCLVPTIADNRYKIVYSSPATTEMIGYKAEELEGRDMIELLYGVDRQPFNLLLAQIAQAASSPSISRDPSTSTSDASTPDGAMSEPGGFPTGRIPRGESVTAFFRLVGRDSVARVWEFRAHGYFGDSRNPTQTANSPEPNGGFDGGGIMGTAMNQPQSQFSGDTALRAIWLMGRKLGGTRSRDEDSANSKTLDAFLDLKLENERLREELMELQADMSDDNGDDGNTSYRRHAANNSVLQSSRRTSDTYNRVYQPNLSDPGSDSSSDSEGSGSASSSAGGNDIYQSKAPTASSSALPGTGPRGAKRKSEPKPKKARPSKPITGMLPSGAPQKLEEGMHVCVTCGRTDSPEWRKGPLGPKTLCNACGLRWAKRNSTAPTRRERKPAGETKKAQAPTAAHGHAHAQGQGQGHHGQGHP